MAAVESSPLCVVTKPLPARRTWHLSVLTTRSNTNWWAKYHFLWSVFEIYNKASSWIFLTANQLLPNGCANNMGLDTTYSRKLVIVNQLISSKLRNNVVANKSWMTVFLYTSNLIENVNCYPILMHISFLFKCVTRFIIENIAH